MTTVADAGTMDAPLENYIGYRARVGVVIPSTNTAVEYDLGKISLPGVTWHPGRFFVESPALDTDDAFLAFLEFIRTVIPIAVRDLLTCAPTAVMLGMSAETFWRGLAGNEEFIRRVKEQIGDIPLTTGAAACVDALHTFGARRLGVLTPYQPIGDENVRAFFGDMDFDVRKIVGLRCATATSIAHTPRTEVFEAVRELEAAGVDAIVQVGTNLSAVDIFPTLEHQLGKPVIPINIANAWHTLRTLGIQDQIAGMGLLFEEH